MLWVCSGEMAVGIYQDDSSNSMGELVSDLALVAPPPKMFEASTSSSHSVWNYGFDSDEEDGIDWVEGDDFPWEGAGIYPRDQKAWDDAAAALFLSGVWSFPRVL